MGSVTMAVDGYKLLAALNIPKATLTLMKQHGIQVHVQPKYVKLSKVVGGKATVLSSFECQGFAAPSVLNHTMPSNKFAALQVDATEAVAKALKEGVGPLVVGVDLGVEHVVNGTSDVLWLWDENEYAGSYFTIDESKDAPKEPVHLHDAKWLGQPVKGTSANSIYHCVAVGSHFKVAARRDPDGNLSVRVGGRHEFFSEILKKMGFQVKDDYASVHLATNNDVLRIRQCIGSMVFGLPGRWYSPWPTDVLGAL